MIWGSLKTEKEIVTDPIFLVRALWELLSWSLIIWFVLLIIFLFQMILMPSVREQVTRRIANIKERDERESYLTGKASRSVFISTLSILIVLFFFSIFSFNIRHLAPEEVVNGHNKNLSITMNFKVFDDAKKDTSPEGTIVESRDLPLSKSAILLLLIIWQVANFNWSARKFAHEE